MQDDRKGKQEKMSNRRRPARERLEIYLVHLILMYRRLFLIFGLLLLAFAVSVFFASPPAGIAALLPAVHLFLLGHSFNAVLYTARLGAWIGTLWARDG